MSEHLFDQPVDRRNTNSLKHDFSAEHNRPADALPLWIADMDFQAPAPVLQALHRAVDHGIFGYSEVKQPYERALSNWFSRRHSWATKPEWLVKTPGVVVALAAAVRALTRPGEAVLVQPPVYYPFFNVIGDNGRTIAPSPLIYRDGRYTVDFESFEHTIVQQKVRLFLLCSPHNPVGRVWTLDELRRMGQICLRHGVAVVSDEIHCDFAFDEHPHITFLRANPELEERTIVCTAPSKTFNLAGLQVSNIWIPGQSLRADFSLELKRSGYSHLNALGLVACQAAYEQGEPWLDQCRAYLRANLDFVRASLAERIPQIRLVEPDGTYFAWLDCSGLGLNRKRLNDLMIHRAGLWLDGGHIFGADAWQFQRMVLASPRATLERAMEQLERAINSPDAS